MDIESFFAKVNDNAELEGVFIDTENKVVAVKHTTTGLCTTLPTPVIEQVEWDTIEEVLTCKREPSVLYHMTRIVGYYSRVENWNNSKLGEMKARIRGDYALENGVNNNEERLNVIRQIQDQ